MKFKSTFFKVLTASIFVLFLTSWSAKMTEINVIEKVKAIEKVNFVNDLSIIPSKKNYTFMVSYVAKKSREIVVEVWKGEDFISAAKKIVKRGDNMTYIDLNMSETLVKGYGYSLKLQIRPIGSSWEQATGRSEFPNVTVR